jgi:hypothetical protein
MEIFGANYENLQGTIFEIAESFGLQNDIAYDQIISEKEDPGGIGTCRDVIMESAGEVEAILPFCGSDITVGPVKRDYYESAFEEARTDEPFWVTAAVVQILEPIDTESGPLPPGDYRMDYWFDENAEFYAATIIDQRGETWRVPAVPAALVNQDGSDQPGAQISTCQIFRKCTFFQRSCR